MENVRVDRAAMGLGKPFFFVAVTTQKEMNDWTFIIIMRDEE